MSTPPTITLYCLPHAGGSAAMYAPLRRRAPAWLRIEALDLPGHGTRYREPLHSERPALLAQLTAELLPRLTAPYAVFGHSMGGLLAFELCHAFAAHAVPQPLALFAAAADAPSLRNPQLFAHDLSDADIERELIRLGGTPPEVLASRELMQLALPVLRADFRACLGAAQKTRESLSVPLHVLAGRSDRFSEQRLAAWRSETSAAFSLAFLDAGHFFVRSHVDEVLQQIVLQLEAR